MKFRGDLCPHRRRQHQTMDYIELVDNIEEEMEQDSAGHDLDLHQDHLFLYHTSCPKEVIESTGPSSYQMSTLNPLLPVDSHSSPSRSMSNSWHSHILYAIPSHGTSSRIVTPPLVTHPTITTMSSRVYASSTCCFLIRCLPLLLLLLMMSTCCWGESGLGHPHPMTDTTSSENFGSSSPHFPPQSLPLFRSASNTPHLMPSFKSPSSSASLQGNHPPKFISNSGSEIIAQLKEGPSPVGKEILTLYGEDPDGDQLTFGVQGIEGNEILRIENVPRNNSAIVYLRTELDRETKDSYSLVLTLTDGHIGKDKFITKTLLIVVEDVNDNEPVFKPFLNSVILREDSDKGIVETVEAIDPDNGRFGQVLYRLQEIDKEIGPEMFRIETVDGKGVISLVNQLDYEKKSLYQLRILATDRGQEHEKKTAMATLTVHVKDINDNPPRFTKRLYTGGVTTEADYGSAVLQVRAIDADSGPNAEVRYFINGTIKRRLSYGMDTIRSDPFIMNSKSGEITLNFDPQPAMKGYFEFNISARDSGGFMDSARVYIYLLREDQRVRFVLRLAPSELREKLEKFMDVMNNITGAIVNVDSYKFHETFDGNVDKRRTDLYLHFVNPSDNSIMEVDSVLALIDKNSDYLNELFKEFNVLLSEPAVDRQEYVIWEDQVRACLIGSTAFLALLLILVTCLCLNQRIRYERILKATTTTVTPSFLDGPRPPRTATHVPNTNMHADEGSNPIWMTGYDNEWYTGDKEDEHVSENHSHSHSGGGNSLDENAVGGGSSTEPTTPTDSLNGSERLKGHDRASLCKGIGKRLSRDKSLPKPVKTTNNNNHNNRNLHNGFEVGYSTSNKKVSAPRPPISMPIPLHPSLSGGGPTSFHHLPHNHMAQNNGHHHLPHHPNLMVSRPSTTSPNSTTNSTSPLTAGGSASGNKHEVTCKNSVNTIYISSANGFDSGTSTLNSPIGNNLSLIPLETTEL